MKTKRYYLNKRWPLWLWVATIVLAGCSKDEATKIELDNEVPNNETLSLKVVEATANANFTARSGHEAVLFDDKLWVLGGSTTNATNEIWNSPDGIDWAQPLIEDTDIFTKRFFHEAEVYDNKIWIIGGSGENGFLNDVWNSDNGTEWKKVVGGVGTNQFPVRGEHTVTVFNNKLWVIGGVTNGAVKLNDVWSSENGANWNLETDNAAFGSRNFHQTSAFDGKLWVVGGLDENENSLNDVWSSEDGITWTVATPNSNFSKRFGHQVLTFDNKIWIIGSAANNDIWYSEDGITWTDVTPTPSYPARNNFASAVFEDKLWIISGEGEDDIWYFEIN